MKTGFPGWLAGLPSWCLLALLLCGCAVVPETGRRQLILLSPAQEMEMGLTAFNEMKKESPVSKDSQANAMLRRVGERIAKVANLPNAQWEFVLFDSKEANAFCLPGGKVGVYTGILPITQDEAGLATVIGHEVAHAVARHGGERVSEAMILQTGASGLPLAGNFRTAASRNRKRTRSASTTWPARVTTRRQPSLFGNALPNTVVRRAATHRGF
jgi:predicted Zn-dependent protease